MAQAIKITAASPIGALTPEFPGQICVDTTNNVAYIAYGTTNADWQEVGGGSGGGGGVGAGSQVVTLDSSTSGALSVDVEEPYVIFTGERSGSTTINCPNPSDTAQTHLVRWVAGDITGISITPGTGWPTDWEGGNEPSSFSVGDELIFRWVPDLDAWRGSTTNFSPAA
jgi:hypothetical protein